MVLDPPGPLDRRVQRSRAALLAAAVRLVTERGTTSIPVTDLAAAASVSRQLVYLQFGDRESLLVAAAADLVTRELMGQGRLDARSAALRAARHFAAHRRYYRAMLTGSCSYAMTKTLTSVFIPFHERFVAERFTGLDPATAADLSVFLTGGAGAVINDWLVEGPDPLDPEEVAGRLSRLARPLGGGPTAPGPGAGATP